MIVHLLCLGIYQTFLAAPPEDLMFSPCCIKKMPILRNIDNRIQTQFPAELLFFLFAEHSMNPSKYV